MWIWYKSEDYKNNYRHKINMALQLNKPHGWCLEDNINENISFSDQNWKYISKLWKKIKNKK